MRTVSNNWIVRSLWWSLSVGLCPLEAFREISWQGPDKARMGWGRPDGARPDCSVMLENSLKLSVHSRHVERTNGLNSFTVVGCYMGRLPCSEDWTCPGWCDTTGSKASREKIKFLIHWECVDCSWSSRQRHTFLEDRSWKCQVSLTWELGCKLSKFKRQMGPILLVPLMTLSLWMALSFRGDLLGF